MAMRESRRVARANGMKAILPFWPASRKPLWPEFDGVKSSKPNAGQNDPSGDAHHVERDAKDLQIEGIAEPADKIADLRPLQITPKTA